jgi:hypothetical protein
MRKALSPMVSVVILIVISISIASFVAPWMFEMISTMSNQTTSDTQLQIKCRNAGLGFDTTYGYYGVDYNFTGNTSDWLKAKVENTGNVNLWGFSFEVTLDSSAGEEIRHYDPTPGTQKTESDSLRPSMAAILAANIVTDINSSIYTLKKVKVLNSECNRVAPTVDM